MRTQGCAKLQISFLNFETLASSPPLFTRAHPLKKGTDTFDDSTNMISSLIL